MNNGAVKRQFHLDQLDHRATRGNDPSSGEWVPGACAAGARQCQPSWTDSSLPELAGLVVAGRLLDDDVHAVVGVDEGDEGHKGGQLVLVVVLGGIGPGLVGDTTGCVGDAGALLGQLQGSALASVKTLASRQAATKFRRVEVSPACAASLLCMSVQKPQPLI